MDNFFKFCFLYEIFSFTERSMERDNFMSPMEAKEFGIIDKVLANPMQEETTESEIEKTGNATTQL